MEETSTNFDEVRDQRRSHHKAVNERPDSHVWVVHDDKVGRGLRRNPEVFEKKSAVHSKECATAETYLYCRC